MENFILSLNVVLPLFLIMAVGYLLRRIGLLDDTVLPKLNSLVFKAFLPMMLFNNIYHSDLESMMNPKLILTAVVSILVIFGVLCLVIPRIEKDGPRRGANKGSVSYPSSAPSPSLCSMCSAWWRWRSSATAP